jgi:hypothetical protein
MTADQIINARQMIGCGWKVVAVARHYKLKENELRVALGMPVYETTSERVVLPWEKRQMDLFNQPERGEISDR